MTPAVDAARQAGVTYQVLEYRHDSAAESFGLEAAEALAEAELEYHDRKDTSVFVFFDTGPDVVTGDLDDDRFLDDEEEIETSAPSTEINGSERILLVDDEQGIKWQLVSYNDFVNKTFIFRVYNNLDLGLSLPINICDMAIPTIHVKAPMHRNPTRQPKFLTI